METSVDEMKGETLGIKDALHPRGENFQLGQGLQGCSGINGRTRTSVEWNITRSRLLQSDHVISDGSNETLYNEYEKTAPKV
ncbi:hypothetical protein J6590_084408 [Homalodisca vitripennis]|nr:hypothetical protein J6590_084408 [Homalodisca vitripennis]